MRRCCIYVRQAGRCSSAAPAWKEDVGCLLGWAKHFSLHLPFSGFSFAFFSFSCLFPAAIFLILGMVRRRLASPYGRLGVA